MLAFLYGPSIPSKSLVMQKEKVKIKQSLRDEILESEKLEVKGEEPPRYDAQ